MTGPRAAALVAAALAIAILASLLARRDASRSARARAPDAPSASDARGALPAPEARAEAAAERAAALPVEFSFHFETGSGAILVELSIRPDDARVHLKMAGSSVMGRSGRGDVKWHGALSLRGHVHELDLALDRAMRLESLSIRSCIEPPPGAETLFDLFGEDGRTIASERPPSVLDPKGAAYVLERRRAVAGGVARDLVATLRPAD